MGSDVETYYEFGSWRNWSEGSDLGDPHPSRDDAVAAGRRAAAERRGEHVVRDEDGTVVERVAP